MRQTYSPSSNLINDIFIRVFIFKLYMSGFFFQVLSWKQSYTPEVFLLGHAQTKVLSTYPNKINLPRTIRTTPPSIPSASDETPPE